VGAIGIDALTPGTDATRTTLWSNTGTTDVIIYALSANTGAGVGDLVVRYIQAENA
jgi:energy-converting hydrogenase Eha subunit E